MTRENPHPPERPLVARSPKLKRKWLRLPDPPASLEATLANVAQLEAGLVLPAADVEVEKMLQRPYTSGGVSAASVDALFSAENSTFSTRPSTSAGSLSRRAISSRRQFRARPWGRTSPCSSLRGTSRLTSRASRGSSALGDWRGYETFEKLLQPDWTSLAEARGSGKPEDEVDASLASLWQNSEEDEPYFSEAKRNAVVLGRGKPIWSVNPELARSHGIPQGAQSVEAPREKRNAVKIASVKPLHLPASLASAGPADESSSSASSASETASSESLDPLLATEIGDLLPQKNIGFARTLTMAQQTATQTRRAGLDAHMMELAEFAVAAQQAAMREEQEAHLPVEVLPGVYFGHTESPRSNLLPRTPKVGRLQTLEHKRLQEDNVHQRKILNITHEDHPPFSRMSSAVPREEDLHRTGGKKKMASTWGDLTKEPAPPKLSAEEEERIKEEKAQYDDWRRQVLLCARHLSTHINLFETDPLASQKIHSLRF
mmetsp:Transcript_64660/g.151982  ORF Transcript_64660/g.151982 Transcript_64660/m.151982 type:complete len:489 (-) Transcript_64660:100-1566(-)